MAVVRVTHPTCSLGYVCTPDPLNPRCRRTLVYSAPELLHGDTYEATAVDVWASGVLLVVSLLGAFPWVRIRAPCKS